MKQIVLKYPDDMRESDAILYLEDVFNVKKFDYKKPRPAGKQWSAGFRYGDGKVGVFYRTNTAYVLEIHDDEQEGKP